MLSRAGSVTVGAFTTALAISYTLLLLLAVMGTYFIHHAITPHQQDCLGKWFEGTHAQVAGDTHFL